MPMTLFRPGGLELTRKAAETIKLKPGDRVLDIGCGPGTSLVFLAENYGAEPYGVDVQPETVRKAAALLGVERVQCADACALPFEDGGFQAVLMECVLTLTARPEKALSEAARVLCPGGSLVISSLEGADGLCEQGRLGRAALAERLGELGMELVSVSDERAALHRFVAEAIFEYDSLENYIAAANRELGGSVLGCEVPVKNTGYLLMTARKK